MTVDRLDKIDGYPNHKVETSLAVTEYELIREKRLVSEGYDRHEAFTKVRDDKRADNDAFTAAALDFEKYRQIITDKNEGISAEMFNFALTVNPAQVLLDAANWAAINRLKEQAS